jgi:diaminohydroxyphosphoribosylaminopyrimidine deaminase/5-amino-6-(5-phosphoribosylamino)uracil reductase
VRTARDIPTYVVATTEPDPALVEAGVKVLTVRAVGEDRPELKTVVQTLEQEGLSSLFVEGGGQVAASFLRCDLVDLLEWFRAPVVIGGEGRPAVGALAVMALAEAPRFRRLDLRELGRDVWERYERI